MTDSTVNNLNNPLDQVRNKGTINLKDLINIFWGSEENYKLVNEYTKKESKNGFYIQAPYWNLSRKDQLGQNIRDTQRWRKVMKSDLYKNHPNKDISTAGFMIGGIGQQMAPPIIDVAGTVEQRAEWIDKINNGDYVVAYAQTEMGTGSDVQGLQTTATWQPETQNWDIHTPNITAYKWWPGDLAKSANWIILTCKVVVGGTSHGTFPFFLQIRDMNTHKTLPGINVGDIGAKHGYNFKDNGFISFNHFKIPKNSLLGKFVEINSMNEFKTKGNQKVMYGAMMTTRSFIISSLSFALLYNVCIAVRYSNICKDEDNEKRIIEQQTQKNKIYPYLAKAYMMRFSTQKIVQLTKQNLKLNKKKDFSLMEDLHIRLCGAKAMYTMWGTEGVSELMLACGVNGLQTTSGFHRSHQSSWNTVIMEGENHVMLLQVGRSILKNFRKATLEEDAEIPKVMSYLKNLDSQENYEFPKDKKSLQDINEYIQIFSKTLLRLIQKIVIKLNTAISEKDQDPMSAFNKVTAVSQVEASKIHVVLYTLKDFNEFYNTLPAGEIKTNLYTLCMIFALEQLKVYAYSTISTNTLNQSSMSILTEIYEEQLDKIHPNALILAEGHGILDEYLGSTIGNSNGKPYENIVNASKEFIKSNQNDVTPIMVEYINAKKQELVRPRL